MVSRIKIFLKNPSQQYFRNFAPCGTGKTTILSQIICEVIRHYPEFRVFYVIPNHKMVLGKDNLIDMFEKEEMLHRHMRGKVNADKDEESLCKIPKKYPYRLGCESTRKKFNEFSRMDSSIDNYYNATTKKMANGFPLKMMECDEYDRCPYRKQFKDLDEIDSEGNYKYQVVIGSFEMYQILMERGEYKFPLVVFEESFDNKILDSVYISQEKVKSLKLKLKDDSDNLDERLREIFSFYTVKFKSSELPKWALNEDDYTLLQFMKRHKNDNVFAVKTNVKPGVYELFTKWKVQIGNRTKVIFNCATTPYEAMEVMFDKPLEDWDNFKPEYLDSIVNPSIIFGNSELWWGVNQIESYLDVFKIFLLTISNQFEKINGRKPRIIVITKLKTENKKVKKELENLEIENLHVVHYGASRGSNRLNSKNGCDLAIVYGRYGLTQRDIEKYKRIGLSEKVIQQLVYSDILQAIHRVRPLLHPEIPLILCIDPYFSEELYIDYEELTEKRYPPNYMKRFTDVCDMSPLASYNAIKARLGLKSNGNTIPKKVKDLLKFFWRFVYKSVNYP